MSGTRLRNDGENNCFINSVIQVFYNILPIRGFFLSDVISSHCENSTNSTNPCLLCPIKNVLGFMEVCSVAVPTDLIRESLQAIDKTSISFQRNSRGCAIETLELILNNLHSTDTSEGHVMCLAHRFFTLEKIYQCRTCRSVETKEEENFLIISGMVLTEMMKFYNTEEPISFIFNSMIGDSLVKNRKCECEEQAKCSLRIVPPPFFTICLAWEGEISWSSKIINFIDKQKLDLMQVFGADTSSVSPFYELESMVCFCKILKHYVAVVKSSKGWSVKSDESTFSASWGMVKFGMKMTGLTPVILIYKLIV